MKLLHLVICSFSFHYDLDSFNLKRQLVKPRTYWTWHQSSCASLGLIKDLDMGWSTFSESPWLLPRTAAGTLQPPLPNVAVCSHSWAHRAFPASSFLPWKNVFPKVKSELGTTLGGWSDNIFQNATLQRLSKPLVMSALWDTSQLRLMVFPKAVCVTRSKWAPAREQTSLRSSLMVLKEILIPDQI